MPIRFLLSVGGDLVADLRSIFTTIAVAAPSAAILGFVANEWRRRRDDLDKRINEKVDAKIGSVLIGLRQLEKDEQEVKARLDTLRTETLTAADNAEFRAKTMLGEMEMRLALFPSLESMAAVPSVLISEARLAIHNGEEAKANVLLFQLLSRDDTDSDDLERAGDVARSDLQNAPLARRLYQRAVEVNPDNVSAEVRLLHLYATKPAERASALSRLQELVDNDPNNWNILRHLIYFYQDTNNLSGLTAIGEDLLKKSSQKSLLYRNLAEAYVKTTDDPEKIRNAFENAVSFSRKDSNLEFVHAVLAYTRYLLGTPDGNVERAGELIEDAIKIDPMNSQLYGLRAKHQQRSGQLDEALKSYDLMSDLGDTSQSAEAQHAIHDIRILLETSIP